MFFTYYSIRVESEEFICKTNKDPAIRVGKVSGIEVSGRVSGMPEIPGTKPRFWAPETARNCTKLPETINLEI